MKRPNRWRLSRRLLWSFALLTAIPIAVVGFGIRQYTRTLLQRSLDRRVDLTRRLVDNWADGLRLKASEAVLRAGSDSTLLALMRTGVDRRRLQAAVDNLALQTGVGGVDVVRRQGEARVLLARSGHESHFGFPVRMQPGGGAASVWPVPELGSQCFGVARYVDPESLLIVAAYVPLDAGLLSGQARPGLFSIGVVNADSSALVVGEMRIERWPDVTDRPGELAHVALGGENYAVGRTGPFFFGLSLAENEAALTRLDGFLLAAILLAVVIALLAAWRVSVSAARPVEELAATVEQWGRGSQPEPLVTFAEGETATLVDAFEHLRGELAAAERRLADTARASGWQEMARKVAHEIKNPLTPIRITMEDLARRVASDPQRAAAMIPEAAKLVSEEVAALGRIVDAFARFARLPEPSFRRVDLRDVASHVIQLYASERGPQVKYETPDAAATVVADPELLREAVGNLVKNGLEAGGETAAVTVRVAADGATCSLEVSDNGPGFPEALLADGPRPYFTTKAGGTGLGLMMAQRIVLDLGGALELRNDHGGAVARMTFDRAERNDG